MSAVAEIDPRFSDEGPYLCLSFGPYAPVASQTRHQLGVSSGALAKIAFPHASLSKESLDFLEE